MTAVDIDCRMNYGKKVYNIFYVVHKIKNHTFGSYNISVPVANMCLIDAGFTPRRPQFSYSALYSVFIANGPFVRFQHWVPISVFAMQLPLQRHIAGEISV